jgi:amidase
VVARLRQAGAIIVDKTNAHFMLADFAQTFNEVYGRTSNPWDPELTPGGSSGGSAAAVAAGATYFDYGSDLVGSVRIPAAFCGVYGLKPSVGIVPLTGLQPPGPPAPPSEMMYMSHLGPLARAAGDLRIALAATAGPENPAYSWTLPQPALLRPRPGGNHHRASGADRTGRVRCRLSEVRRVGAIHPRVGPGGLSQV